MIRPREGRGVFAGLQEARCWHVLVYDAEILVVGCILRLELLVRGGSVKSSRETVGNFEYFGRAILVSSGGIGGDLEKMEKAWPLYRLGPKAPQSFVGLRHADHGMRDDFLGQAGTVLTGLVTLGGEPERPRNCLRRRSWPPRRFRCVEGWLATSVCQPRLP